MVYFHVTVYAITMMKVVLHKYEEDRMEHEEIDVKNVKNDNGIDQINDKNDQNAQKRSYTCSLCKESGHNKQKCHVFDRKKRRKHENVSEDVSEPNVRNTKKSTEIQDLRTQINLLQSKLDEIENKEKAREKEKYNNDDDSIKTNEENGDGVSDHILILKQKGIEKHVEYHVEPGKVPVAVVIDNNGVSHRLEARQGCGVGSLYKKVGVKFGNMSTGTR